MMSGAITRSLLLSYSLGVQPWEAGSVMRRWDRLSLTRITKTRSLVPPSATPVKLGYQIMWLALRHPEQVRDLHSKAGCSQLSAKEQGRAGGSPPSSGENALCQREPLAIPHILQPFPQTPMLLGPEALGSGVSQALPLPQQQRRTKTWNQRPAACFMSAL